MASVFILFIGAFLSPQVEISNLQPLFPEGKSSWSAVIAVVALVYFIVVMVKKKQGRLPQRLRVVPVEELPPRPTKEERRAAQAAKRSKTKNKGVNEEKNGTDH